MADVTIYTRLLCGYCATATALLKRKHVVYKEIDTTFDPDLKAEMVKSAGGHTTVPQIFIGKRHIGGFSEIQALEEAGKLDALLQDN